MSVEHPAEGWLSEPYDYQRPRRGQIRKGMILRLEEQGATIDVGLKRDGFVPQADIERLGEASALQLEVGQEVVTRIVRPRDRDGNLILSLYQARLEKDWMKAQELLESGQVWQGQVTDSNRGGLLVEFHRIRGFIPASHLWALNNRRLSSEQRQVRLKAYVGQELSLKVIEVDRDRHRMILSERLARQQLRQQSMEHLLSKLQESQVVQGTVSQLCDFGAFVDVGGADGLVHLSELAWQRIRHPSEVVQIGEKVKVYILHLDHKRKRISLSLKRLQPSPWDLIDETYVEGQLVSGIVTNVVDFGVFVVLDIGVEGLIHVSELADPPPSNPREMVRRGEELVLRILRIDSLHRRIGLSLKRVSAQERDELLARQTANQTTQIEKEKDNPSEDEETRPTIVPVAEGTTSVLTEQAIGKNIRNLLPNLTIPASHL